MKTSPITFPVLAGLVIGLFWLSSPDAAADSYTFSTLAGLPGSAGSADGTGTGARFGNPWGIALDSAGNIYVGESNNNIVRKVNPNGTASLLAGAAGQIGSADGTGAAARFSLTDVAVDGAGNIYVSDTGNHTIRKITPNGAVTTLAGSAGQSGSADGTGSAARFNNPIGVAVDSGGTVYVGDHGNRTIRRISPSGAVSTFAGSAGQSGSDNGTGTAARFFGIYDVAVDGAGNVYVADSWNMTIRKITPAGVVSTLAGSAGQAGSADGTGNSARFNNPQGVAVDSAGHVYVADRGNHTIRKITPAGVVTTIGGLAGSSGTADGVLNAARFNSLQGVAVDGSGNIYVADTANHTIRKGTMAALAQAPVITTAPQNQTSCQGAAITLQVAATGTPPLSYQWRKDGANLANATSATLSLNNVQSAAAGDYTVAVSNSAGSVISQPARLTVNLPPTITSQPQPRTATVGSALTLEVTATGSAPLSYQWRKNGGNIAGATDRILALANVQTSDSGNYDVVVSNTCAQTSSQSATITVNPVTVAPVITAQPQALEIAVGGTATFNVAATGTAPLAYQWRKDSSDLLGATNPTLTLNNVQPAQAGSYSVRITNAAGTVTSAEARLTVNVPPSIAAQPQGQTTCLGSSAAFQVAATGTPAPSFQWRKNGAALAGSTSSTLILNSVQAGDAAEYTVVVTNAGGAVTSLPARLTVNLAPAISGQPQNKSATVGSNALFDVTASGTEPLSYQWFKGSAAISGATDRLLVLRTVQSADAGNYTVEISNACGKVWSEAAILTLTVVEEPPRITAQPQNQTVPAGASVTFTVAATGTGQLTYQWKENGSNLPGANQAALTLNNVTVAKSGNKYSVVITGAGSVTSQEATLTVTPVQTGTSFITRRLPGGYVPGAALTVTLEVTPPSSSASHVVEDQPPAGWTVSNVAAGGAFEAANRKVKFGPYFDTTPRTLTYQATPPNSENGEKSFSGVGSADGVSSAISGETVIKLAQYHPADNKPADWVIAASEITGYGAAWKRGDTWEGGPNPIPSSYVSRAGFLWKNGEAYKIDASVTSGAPLWWVNAARAGQTLRDPSSPVRKSSPPANSAISSLPVDYTPGTAVTVSITVTPASDAFSYVVEDQPPAGWTVSGITQGGLFDANNRKVKWGPFFDNTARTLAYQVTPPSGAAGIVNFTGLASFDGADVTITGQRSTTAQSAPPPPDSMGPVLAITSHTPGQTLSSPTITLTGTATDAGRGNNGIASVTVNGTRAAGDTAGAGGTANWSRGITLLPGPNVITVVARDNSPAQNTVTQTITLTYPAVPSGGNSAVSTLPASYTPGTALTVSLVVTPDFSAFSYVVEDQPPLGWTVSNISQGGLLDTGNRKVKWGPFFDNTARTLTYQVTPPAAAAGSVSFAGLASFDGANVTITGQRTTISEGRGTPPAPISESPMITPIPDQVLIWNKDSDLVNFSVDDKKTPPAILRVTVASDNPALVPNASIQVAPADPARPKERQLILRPAANQFGLANITVTVIDGDNLTASTRFQARVIAPPSISPIGNQTLTRNETSAPIELTVDDPDTFAGFLTIMADSSNQALAPLANISWAGNGRNRRLTITPAPNQEGRTFITLTVLDPDGLSASATFVVSVAAKSVTLTVSAGPNGSVSPGVPLRKNVGESQLLTAVPADGFAVDQWLVNQQVVQTGGNTYTVQNLQQDTVVFVTFKEAPARTRVIRLEGELSFGDVPVGGGTERALRIVNDGNEVLTINSISTPPGFRASWSGAIEPGKSHTLNVVFEPAAEGDYSGRIEVIANKTGGASTVAVSGRAISQTSYAFGNPERILINDRAAATPYPSRIAVAGVRGLVSAVTVTLHHLSHTYTRDLGALLVSPQGQQVVLMRKTGGKKAAAAANSVTLTFSPDALSSLPAGAQIVTGTFKPADFAPGAVFPSSAPAGPYAPSLDAFNGVDPNGAWLLYVADTEAEDTGVIDRGWSLTFSTGSAVANTPPSISAIADVTTRLNTPTPQIVFSVTDKETPESISVTARSSNTSLAPDANVAISSAGANRTVVITPVPGQTGATTITLTAVDAGGKTASASFSVTVVSTPRTAASTPGDFNQDGLPDLVFQDRDGFLAAWHMNGASLLSAALLEPNHVGDPSFRIVASADFDQDGQEDLLFQNRAGMLAVWRMDGTRLRQAGAVDPGAPETAEWSAAAAADLSGDGKPDVVLQHSNGSIDVWFMDGLKRAERIQSNPNTPGDRHWRIIGTGDFNGDRQPDLVFQHSDGSLAVWMLSGTTMTAGLLLNPQRFGDANARAVSAADRDQDGQADLLFQNATDGSLTLWIMDGVTRASVQLLNPSKPGGTWSVAAPR